MVKIVGVEEGSHAMAANILPGDVLISISGNDINDVLDYRFYLTEKNVTLLLLRDGTEYETIITKEEYDDLGLVFETPLMDKKHSCKNGCIFCFIDQNPRGMRETIYFKDDDSRLSFIHGNYVTLTNMTDADVERIIKMRISPINVSIHTTNPELRVSMMKNKRAGEVLKYLDDFKRAGLTVAGQIVLCRGVNDGDELRRTLGDLISYYPSISSVSIVPAGLTKHRDGLYPLAPFTQSEAEDVIDTVDEFARECIEKYGTRIFFASDEFYLTAKRDLPPEEFYEGYPQIDNGVGMLRSITEEALCAIDEVRKVRRLRKTRREVSLATGVSSYPLMCKISDMLMSVCPKLKINVYRIINNFYGESITVSGLLTGRDIKSQLSGMPLGDELILPKNALRHEGDLFLCGMSCDELSESLGVCIRCAGEDGYELVSALLGVDSI